MRLSALWRSRAVLRLQPGGISTWWVQHCDPHMRALLDADRGPFYRCHKAHTPAEALRTEAPPPDVATGALRAPSRLKEPEMPNMEPLDHYISRPQPDTSRRRSPDQPRAHGSAQSGAEMTDVAHRCA
jgi:hypothetical protein